MNSALGGFGVGANQGDAQPAAFLNYILFDKNYKVMDAGWHVAPAGSFTKQYVSIPQITVKEAGYIFVYLSYEDQSNNYVYFDDFKVTVTPTAVVQNNEYYPFGLQTANSWTRDNTTNNFLYDAGSELNSISGMYDLPYRNYDAALGRFFQVDPMATSSHNLNPYHYAGNNPISANDPTGLVIDYSTSMENPSYAEAMRREWEQGHMNHLSSEWYNDSWDLGMMFFGRPKGSGNNWHEDDDKKPTILSTHIDAESGIATSLVVGEDGKLYLVSADGEGNYVLNNAFSKSEEEDNLTQSGEPPWLVKAYGELGVHEIDGKTNNPRIMEYFAATIYKASGDGEAWCAAFANWVLKGVGITGTNTAWAPDFESWGTALDKPAYGAIGVVNGAHVGFLVGTYPDGSAILLGGNQSDAVGFSNPGVYQMSDFKWVYPSGYTPNYTVPSVSSDLRDVYYYMKLGTGGN